MSEELLFREPTWEPSYEFPDLSNAREIAIDCETRDPDLKKYGPGWASGHGEVIGIAVATENFKAYYPIAHAAGGNMDRRRVLEWAREQFKSDIPKVFANATYDAGWLLHHGIKCGGPWYDVQIAGPLIDEYRFSYSLDSLGGTYLQEHKDEHMLIQGAKTYGIPERRIKENLYLLPASYIGEYAEQDAALTLRLWHVMREKLISEDLWSIFELETAILPMLVDMRMMGVRIDLSKAEQIRDDLIRQENELLAELKRKTGMDVDVWSNKKLAELYDSEGLAYTKTEKGNPSFTSDELERNKDPLSSLIFKTRKTNRARTAFIENMVIDQSVNGRIHCSFHSLRAERKDGAKYGTVSGRFSSSGPNLQQVPIRNPEVGPLIRSMFIPEDGCLWGSGDYSQQEPRLTIHYAARLALGGAMEAVEAYRNNPDIDHHQLIADMAHLEGKEGRQKAKTINLGMSYCMGKKKLAEKLNMPMDEAVELFAQYHQHVPFVKRLTEVCSNRAADMGFIKTLLGRKAHFNTYEPAEFGTKALPVQYEEALRLRLDPNAKDWFNKPIRRAGTYKALNRLIQGSAADMTKKAMLDIYRAGYLPALQVHDELDFGNLTNEKQAKEIKEIMENCVELLLPIKCDMGIGASWAEAH